MAWIEMIGQDKAKGFLKKLYEDTVKRAGRIWNITAIMSQNPRILKASMDFYGTLMKGRSPLSKGQREMLGVVVSSTNHCFY